MQIMKPIFLGAVGLIVLSLSAPATAADLAARPYTKAPPAPVALIPTWTGFYVGANLGGGWGHTDTSGFTDGTSAGVPFAPVTVGSVSGDPVVRRNSSGILGGGQLGFNYEFVPHWVLGLEADADAADINGSNINCSFLNGEVSSCAHAQGKIDAFGTVRGRLGYAFDNLLLYGTGGFAWAHTKGSSAAFCFGAACPSVSAASVVAPPTSVSENHDGWVVGAGAEWRFLPNWTLRAEYLHLQFDGQKTTVSGTETIGATPVVFTFHGTNNINVDVVRVGVNYNFGWAGPVVAKY